MGAGRATGDPLARIAGDGFCGFASSASAAPPSSLARAARTSCSTLRTGSFPRTVFSAISAIVRSLGAPSSARACPSLSSRPITIVRMRAGSFSSRSAFATVARSFPTRSASVCCV